MKHRITALILSLLMILSLVPGVSAGAPGALWEYEQAEDGIRLLKYRGTEEDLTVPTELAGQMVVAIGDGCFRDNTRLKTVEIPYGIRSIGKEAFYRCTSMTKVTLGGTVNTIGDRAFAHTDIASMRIPGSVHTIGSEAFLGCEGLMNIAFEGGVEDAGDIFPTANSDEGTGSVKMSEGVRNLGSRVFFDCINLTRMQIPASVTSIGEQAIGYKTSDSGAVKQKDYLIYGYEGTMGEQYARDNGISFEIMGVIDPTSGICGGNATWAYDNGVLTISGTGRMYDYGAAEYQPWYSLQIHTVILEEGITALGAFALSDTAVSSITLPQTLTQIRQKALANCRSLSEIIFPGDAPAFFRDAFTGTALVAWYPADNATWVNDLLQNYGGQITWRTEGGLPFVDVPVDSFFHAPVVWAIGQSITNGTDATHFSPNNSCQRAQVVTFLWRAMGCPEPANAELPFVDVPEDSFYHDAVAWALEKGITTGSDATHFNPFGLCSRAEAVTFLWRTMEKPDPDSTEIPFTDVPANQWYFTPVAWAVENGITNGMEPTRFGVFETCNRGQIVTFLYRLLK